MKTTFTLCSVLLSTLGFAQVEVEPNNATANANLLAQGGTVSGQLCDGDMDYFDVQPNVQYKLSVSVAAMNTDGVARAVHVKIMDENDVELDASYGSGGTWGQTENSTLEDLCFTSVGRYLRVTGYATGCVSYTLSIGYSTPPVFNSDVEPNEVEFIATPVQLGQAWQGQLHFTDDDDADVFKVNVSERGYLRFIASTEWSSPHATLLAFGVVDSASGDGFGFGNNVVNMGVNGVALTDTTRSMCLGPGTYYIYPAMIEGGCGVSYNITADLIPLTFGPDPEPNNDTLTAIPLSPDTWAEGSSVWGDNEPGDIHDFWRLTKTYEGPLVLFTEAAEASGAFPNGDPEVWPIYLIGPNGLSMELPSALFPRFGIDGAIASDTTFIPQASEPGTYYFPVYSAECFAYRFSYPSFNFAGIMEHNGGAFHVTPNPSSGSFQFMGTNITSIEITDAQGRLIERLAPRISRTWNAEGHAPGVYVARALHANGITSSARLVLTHQDR